MSAVDSVANAVSGVSGTIASLGPNDEKKAVNAAKSAGKAAQKLEEKKYPSWDVAGTKKMAKEMGITTRAQWKVARAEAGQRAYENAYNETMEMYHARFSASVEHQQNQDAVAQTQAEVMQQMAQSGASDSTMVKSASMGGCLGVSALLVGVVSAISGLVYGLVMLI